MSGGSDLIDGGYSSSGSAATSPRRAILEHLEVPLRRPWHVLVPLVLITAGAVLASFLLPQRYRTSTMILVESDKVPQSFVPRATIDNSSNRLLTIREEILSRTRLEQVVQEINPHPEMVASASLTSVVEKMRSAIEIRVKGRDAFSIEYSHQDPKKARDVANRLATLFIDEVSRERQQQIGAAREFIESQLAEAGRQLEGKEDAVRRYKQTQLGSLPEQMAANLSTLQRLQLDQQGVTQNLRAARERLASLEKGLADLVRGVGGAASLVADPFVEIGKLRSRLEELRTRYTDEHPDVRLVLVQIARLEKELTEPSARRPGVQLDPTELALRGQIEAGKRDVASLETREKDLAAQIAAFQARVERTPQVEQELTTLSRDFQKLNENYLALLSKKLDAEMAEKLERQWKGEHFRILDPAHLPERPYYPDHTLFLLAGMTIGLLVGLALSVTAEVFDHSIRSVAEVEAILPYPVLARLPFVDARRTARASSGQPT